MIVETALVAPVVLLLIFGIFEAGMLLLSHLSLEETTRDASRTLAIHGKNADSDVRVLDTISVKLDNIRGDSIQRIVIYQATDVDAEPSAICRTGSGSGSVSDGCSIYTSADFGLDEFAVTCGWCPVDRIPGELIGLWIAYQYESTTGLFPGAPLEKYAVLPLERDSIAAP